MAIKIFVDQGHNPQNPNAGAEGNGYREQDINYEVGVRLAELLEADPNFEVRLSRNTPTESLGTSNTTSLRARVNAANEWGADFFISLHCNASAIESASGSEGYAYSRASQGYLMGENILYWMNIRTGLANRGMFVRPSLYVLRKTTMPAVLIEMGFITNYDDAILLATRPELFAVGIYDGIRQYYGFTVPES